jgi:hypothetical protein
MGDERAGLHWAVAWEGVREGEPEFGIAARGDETAWPASSPSPPAIERLRLIGAAAPPASWGTDREWLRADVCPAPSGRRDRSPTRRAPRHRPRPGHRWRFWRLRPTPSSGRDARGPLPGGPRRAHLGNRSMQLRLFLLHAACLLRPRSRLHAPPGNPDDRRRAPPTRQPHRELPGVAEAMRAAGLAETGHALLSRQLAGVMGTTLLLALPGRAGACTDCLDAVWPALPHALAMLRTGAHP